MSKRTITLTDRAPVTITEESWPVIARATDSQHDGEYDFQANCSSRWIVRVRQHEDGRAIVYATYEYSTRYRGERGFIARRGELLDPGDDIISAIRRVCDDIAQAECSGDDSARWPTLAAECIADLPAVQLD